MTSPAPPYVTRFFKRYMTPYLPWYVAGTVCLFLTNWISVIIPMYVAEGIDAIELGDAGIPIMLNAATWVVGLGVVVIFIRTASRMLFFTPGRLVEAAVERDLFLRILRHQPSFLGAWPTGDLISRVSGDTQMLRLLAGFASLGVVNTIAALVLTGSQMVRISPELAVLAAVPLVLSFALIQLFMRRLYEVMRQVQQVGGHLSDHALASFQGVATVQAFGARQAFADRFEVHNQSMLRWVLERANLRTVFGPVLTLGAAVNVYLLMRIGGPMAIEGTISIGEMVAFITLVAGLTGPLRGMSFIVSLVKQSQAALERIDAVLYEEPERPDLPNPLPAPEQPPAIAFAGATFSYPKAESPALHDLTFEIGAGQTLGVVGPTGSGKSTLLRVLARLYNTPDASIRIDGVDVRAIDLDAWRTRMTLVPQRAFLFSESIADNILLGRDPSLLDEVIRLSALQVDIDALPHGVETGVGEAGVTLSGGQRQRTALARGLVREHVVLLLDDVLSAVDHATEKELIASLEAQDPRPTTVIVAHRLQALVHADRIVVLNEGRVADVGTHDELIQRPGFYRDTWQHQIALGDDHGE